MDHTRTLMQAIYRIGDFQCVYCGHLYNIIDDPTILARLPSDSPCMATDCPGKE